MNSIANEALPIFLDDIVPTYVAVILSVSVVLVFGEILPSAFFTGPQQLKMAARLTPLVWGFIFLFAPLAYPISLALDKLLGKAEDDRYNKAELKALLNLHRKTSDNSRSNNAAIRRCVRIAGTASLSFDFLIA